MHKCGKSYRGYTILRKGSKPKPQVLLSGPLAKVFNTIGEEEGIKIRVKFDIAYCIAIKKDVSQNMQRY